MKSSFSSILLILEKFSLILINLSESIPYSIAFNPVLFSKLGIDTA